MLYDATFHTPPDSFLVEALRRSFVLTQNTNEQLHQIVQRVQAKYGDLPEGTPFKLGPEQIEIQYSSPEAVQQQGKVIEAVRDSLLEDLGNASTLQQQESLLYNSMHDMLDLSVVGHVPARVAHAYAETVLGLFDEFGKDGIILSEQLEDMKSNIEFYLHIHDDALAAAEALTINHQRRNGVAPERIVPMPFDLAIQRATEREPMRELDGRREELMAEAREIIVELTEKYNISLPRDCSVEMLGLILRCSERIHEMKAATSGIKPDRFVAANDNGPDEKKFTADAEEVQLFDNPLVVKRVNHILGQVFLKHMDAGHSPEGIMEAAADLETALDLEEKRVQTDRGR